VLWKIKPFERILEHT